MFEKLKQKIEELKLKRGDAMKSVENMVYHDALDEVLQLLNDQDIQDCTRYEIITENMTPQGKYSLANMMAHGMSIVGVKEVFLWRWDYDDKKLAKASYDGFATGYFGTVYNSDTPCGETQNVLNGKEMFTKLYGDDLKHRQKYEYKG